MRQPKRVVGAALTAALALGALPGIAGSAGPTAPTTIDPSAFQSVQVPAIASTELAVEPPDDALRAANAIDASTVLAEPGKEPARKIPTRPRVDVPAPHGGSSLKPPRYKIIGYASFYQESVRNSTQGRRHPSSATVARGTMADGGDFRLHVSEKLQGGERHYQAVQIEIGGS